MFTETAAYYDLLYFTCKDYAREATQLCAELLRLHPDCRTVLDVACGTGEHARRLGDRGFDVDGLDLNADFVRLARGKHPRGNFIVADMTDFHLDRRYDAVVCLFSSIAYAGTLARVESAFRCFREHLAPGGVVLVEPWFPPGFLEHGRRSTDDATSGDVRIIRRCRVEVTDRMSRLHFDYEIAERGVTRHATEIHELGLFTADEMLDAFERAGLRATFRPEGFAGQREGN